MKHHTPRWRAWSDGLRARPRAAATGSYAAREVVWARAWGFPWWPARVISAVDGGKHRVLFFATRNTSDLDAPALAAWAAHPEWCATKQKKKTLQKPFVAAVAEARAAVEKGGVVDEEAAAVEQAEAQLAAERERIRTLRPSVDKWRTKLRQLEMTKATLLENMKKLYDEAARRVAERDATLRELRGRER